MRLAQRTGPGTKARCPNATPGGRVRYSEAPAEQHFFATTDTWPSLRPGCIAPLEERSDHRAHDSVVAAGGRPSSATRIASGNGLSPGPPMPCRGDERWFSRGSGRVTPVVHSPCRPTAQSSKRHGAGCTQRAAVDLRGAQVTPGKLPHHGAYSVPFLLTLGSMNRIFKIHHIPASRSFGKAGYSQYFLSTPASARAVCPYVPLRAGQVPQSCLNQGGTSCRIGTDQHPTVVHGGAAG